MAESTYPYYGFPPLPETLEYLAKQSDADFNTLRQAISGPDGFSRSINRCRQLARELGNEISTNTIFNLIISLRYLYDNSREWEEAGRDVRVALDEYFELTGLKTILGDDVNDSFYDRVLSFIEKNPVVERARKRRRLQAGILDTATGFSSFVDLRPQLSEDKTEIEELIPVIIFQAETEAQEKEGTKTHVFQLTLESLKKLKDTIGDIERKLETVKDNPRLRAFLQSLSSEENTEG